MLNRAEAGRLLDWANDLNPGPWKDHSLTAARAACAIAGKAGMDADRAWVLGALHDIGRYEGVRGMHHLIAGYGLMMEKGDPVAARICLTHSFPDGNIENYIGGRDVTPEEWAFIRDSVVNAEMDDYERLIQLCDAICLPSGVCLIEKRLMEVALRYGDLPAGIVDKWRAYMKIQKYFEEKTGGSIYRLFEDAVPVTFGF